MTKLPALDAAHFDAVTLTLNPAIDQTLAIDNFTSGEVHRVQSATSVAGGKGVNVAAALADFGLNIAATGFLGRDNDALFSQLFARKKIADRFVRLDGATRTGIKIADAKLNITTDINFPGLAPTARDLEILQAEILNCTAQWFVLAGSLPPNMDANFYGEITKKLRARGARVAFDSSGEALKTLLDGNSDALPQLIKPNIGELEDLLKTKLPTRDGVLRAARELVARGIETVIVSMGADGALFVTENDAVFAIAQVEKIVSTVGAGDAMVAGFIAAQLRGLMPDLAFGLALEESARLATAFSLDALVSLEAGISSVDAIEVLAAGVNISREN